MATLTRNSLTTANQVVVDWVLLTSSPLNGGASVTSYNLYWDAGTSGIGWYSLIGESGPYMNSYYIITNGIQQGTDYQFKIRA